MKYKPPRKEVKIRELPPKVEKTKKGVVILCPFCNPPHAMVPGTVSPCGTVLRVTAIQEYLTSHATKYNKIKCLKCGNFGGEMTRCGNGFVHIAECAPGTKLLTSVPKFSPLAKLVYKLPEKIKNRVEKMTGIVKELQEINAEGVQTGKVLGHFFWKG